MANNNDNKVLNVPPLRFPEFTKEWEEHALAEYLDFKNGLNPDVKRIGRGLPFISVMDILADGTINYDSIRGKVEATEREIENFSVEKGDILFQRSSETLEDVGRANVYMDNRTAVYGGFVIRGRKIGDYNRDAPTTRLFFKKVQNKMHYAVHGHTAAELIVQRANSEKEHMGLTSWENAPDGKIVKPDVVIAKNYLKENELENMAQLVNAVLDLAERMAKRHIPMTMEDWAKRIDIILEAGGDAILADAGKITAEFAKEFAESEFEKYRIVQDRLFSSDFDRFNNGDNLLPFDINPDKE